MSKSKKTFSRFSPGNVSVLTPIVRNFVHVNNTDIDNEYYYTSVVNRLGLGEIPSLSNRKSATSSTVLPCCYTPSTGIEKRKKNMSSTRSKSLVANNIRAKYKYFVIPSGLLGIFIKMYTRCVQKNNDNF